MADTINLHEDTCKCGHLHGQHYFGDSTMDTYCQVKNCGCRNFELAVPTAQELSLQKIKDEILEAWYEPHEHRQPIGIDLDNVDEVKQWYREHHDNTLGKFIDRASLHVAAAYPPLLEQAERRVKELEESNKTLADAAIRINQERYHAVAALESQLKSMVELDENQELPGTETFKEIKAQGDGKIIGVIIDIGSYQKQAQQDMVKAGFRKVKALASTEKGGTK